MDKGVIVQMNGNKKNNCLKNVQDQLKQDLAWWRKGFSVFNWMSVFILICFPLSPGFLTRVISLGFICIVIVRYVVYVLYLLWKKPCGTTKYAINTTGVYSLCLCIIVLCLLGEAVVCCANEGERLRPGIDKLLMLGHANDAARDIAFHALIAFMLIGIAARLWNKRLTSEAARSVVFVVFSLLAFVATTWLTVNNLHMACRYIPCLHAIWKMMWGGVGGVGSWDISWMSIGGTFLAGCLVVISWSKEVPCSTWNPFTAQELSISERVPFIGLALWTAMSYAVQREMNRLAYLYCVILMCVSVATSIRCYQMQNKNNIRARIRIKLDWEHVVYACQEVELLDRKDSNTGSVWVIKSKDGSNDGNSEIISTLVAFVMDFQRISSRVIHNMKHENNREQVSCMQGLIDHLYQKSPQKRKVAEIGLLVGLGCVPYDIDDYQWWKYYAFYIRRLCNEAICAKFDDDAKKEFWEFVTVGIFTGLLATSYYIENSKIMDENLTNLSADIKAMFKRFNDPKIGISSSIECAIDETALECMIKRYKTLIPQLQEILIKALLGIDSKTGKPPAGGSFPENAMLQTIFRQVYR